MRTVALLTASALVLAVPFNATAQVDPGIHRLCIEAKDYAGCVRAMKGEVAPMGGRVINSQGADLAEGNQCTAGFAYIGGGNCQEVKCEYNSSGFNALGHDQLVAGKKDSKGKDVWSCKYSFWHGAGVMRLSGGITRTSNNPGCPSGEPRLGFNNTCQTAGISALNGEFSKGGNGYAEGEKGNDKSANEQTNCSSRAASMGQCYR